MSLIGGPISAGVAGTSGAAEAAGQAKSKREREKSEAVRRYEDAVELRVAGTDSAEAVHGVAENGSEDAKQQRRDTPGKNKGGPEGEPGARVDVTG